MENSYGAGTGPPELAKLGLGAHLGVLELVELRADDGDEAVDRFFQAVNPFFDGWHGHDLAPECRCLAGHITGAAARLADDGGFSASNVRRVQPVGRARYAASGVLKSGSLAAHPE